MTYLTRNEVAKLLNVSPPTVSRMAETGKIPYIRVGDGPRAHFRFALTDVSEICNKRQEEDLEAAYLASLEWVD